MNWSAYEAEVDKVIAQGVLIDRKLPEFDLGIGILSGFGVTALNPHGSNPQFRFVAAGARTPAVLIPRV